MERALLVRSVILFGDIARSVVHVRSLHHAGYRIAGNPLIRVTEFLGALACLVIALKRHHTPVRPAVLSWLSFRPPSLRSVREKEDRLLEDYPG